MNRELNCLFVGVRAHGGEEVYSRLVSDNPPPGVRFSTTLDFHRSCAGGRSHRMAEVLLNRLLYPALRFNLGFRVLSVAPQVDLIHVHSHPTILVGTRHRPLVFSAGSSHYHYLRRYEGWTEQQIGTMYRRASRAYRRLGVADALLNPAPVTFIYTFSYHAREVYLRHGIDERKVKVLYPGFPIPTLRPLEHAFPTYLFLGRDPSRKGGPAVLDAFAAVRGEIPDARLVYVSDRLPQSAPPGVELMPLVPRDEVAGIYSRVDVFVNPTRAEGFGFTNVEAAGFALPVISSAIDAIPEIVDDGRTGLLINPADGRALREAMVALGRDRTRAADLGWRARERFVRLFSLPVFQAGLRVLYDAAVEQARQKADR